MSLEILISKYIDGELTREEDNYLRNLLKENPSAKQKFDSSVELHLEMLDDAEDIKVPVDLLRKTEDRIMMEIFKSAPIAPVYNIKKIKKFNFNYSSAAAAIIIFFFVGVLSIRDSALLNMGSWAEVPVSKPSKTEVAAVSVTKSKINKVSSNKLHLIRTENIRLNSTDETVSNTESKPMSTSYFSDAGPVDSKKSFSNKTAEPDEINTSEVGIKNNLYADSDNGTESKTKQSDDINIKQYKPNQIVNYNTSANIPMNNMDGLSIQVNEIHLTSYVSRDFMRGNIKTHENSPIMNYSQSISYAVNGNSRLGLEFGITQFSYDVNKMVTISNITPSGKSKVEVLDPTDNEGKINIPVRIEQQEQLYWGSFFYEQTLFNFSNFTLLGRAGLGASNDGVLGYGLITANYAVYKGIYLTVGTEGRIFNSQIPMLGYNSLTSSFSIVYGLHFQF